MDTVVSPDYVLAMQSASDVFHCPLDANTDKIYFGPFKIRDMDSNTVLFEIDREYEAMQEEERFIRYTFPPQILNLRTIGTTLFFSVGENPVSNLRLIERHYFRNTLLRCYDFLIPFCMPVTTNTWEAIYPLPVLSAAQKQEIIAHPYEVKSDSFIFVDSRLIIHTRAEYNYSGVEI